MGLDSKKTTLLSALSWAGAIALSHQDQIYQVIPDEYVPFAQLGFMALGIFLHRKAVNTNPDGGPVGAPYQKETSKSNIVARTDRHNNPTAFTTDVARQAGLVYGIDYIAGDPFTVDGVTYYTAKLLGDPIELTIKVIDKLGFRTASGKPRWSHTVVDSDVWASLSKQQKIKIIHEMYKKEGGTQLETLFWSVA